MKKRGIGAPFALPLSRDAGGVAAAGDAVVHGAARRADMPSVRLAAVAWRGAWRGGSGGARGRRQRVKVKKVKKMSRNDDIGAGVPRL
jgi:hypothetical protein